MCDLEPFSNNNVLVLCVVDSYHTKDVCKYTFVYSFVIVVLKTPAVCWRSGIIVYFNLHL